MGANVPTHLGAVEPHCAFFLLFAFAYISVGAQIAAPLCVSFSPARRAADACKIACTVIALDNTSGRHNCGSIARLDISEFLSLQHTHTN